MRIRGYFKQIRKSTRFAEALKNLNSINYLVKQHRSDIQKGDVVYLWESGPDSALLAKARITSEVGILENAQDELEFYVDEPKESSEPRVRLEITETFDSPLPRAEILADPTLSQMQLIRIGRRYELQAYPRRGKSAGFPLFQKANF